jgi:predicted regulator of Ras-like GTPase activity (Roadblock/LC7/MglB family)
MTKAINEKMKNQSGVFNVFINTPDGGKIEAQATGSELVRAYSAMLSAACGVSDRCKIRLTILVIVIAGIITYFIKR